jgi:hypothetical protein
MNRPPPRRSRLAALADRIVPRRAHDGSLQRSLDHLAAEVERLARAQQKQAEQTKLLREMLEERSRRVDSAIRDGSAVIEQRLKGIRDIHAKTAAEWREQFTSSERTHTKWRKSVSRQLGSLVRALFLPQEELPQPFRLRARRFQLYSQHEEDGLTLALAREAGVRDGRFVEIGCGRTGGNSAVLAYECGWAGLMIDGSAEAIEKTRRRFALNPRVVAVAAAVTPENVNALIAEHGFSGEIDVFSLDIDSAEYWVLSALEACSPKILVIEYNALFGSERLVTVPRDAVRDGAPKGYNGASLAALDMLARRRSYRLIVCDDEGSNAFFLRNDVATHLEGIAVAEAYRPFRIRTRLEDDEEERDIFAVIRARGLPLVDVQAS